MDRKRLRQPFDPSIGRQRPDLHQLFRRPSQPEKMDSKNARDRRDKYGAKDDGEKGGSHGVDRQRRQINASGQRRDQRRSQDPHDKRRKKDEQRRSGFFQSRHSDRGNDRQLPAKIEEAPRIPQEHDGTGDADRVQGAPRMPPVKPEHADLDHQRGAHGAHRRPAGETVSPQEHGAPDKPAPPAAEEQTAEHQRQTDVPPRDGQDVADSPSSVILAKIGVPVAEKDGGRQSARIARQRSELRP